MQIHVSQTSTHLRDEPLAYNKITKFDKYENNTYINTKALIYFVEEATSDDEIMPQNIYPSKFYTKFQAACDGIGILEIKNKTHLYFEYRLSLNDSVVNYLWIVKQNLLIDHIDNDVQDSSITSLVWGFS